MMPSMPGQPVTGGDTDGVPRTNADAGLRELQFVAQHPEKIDQFTGRWIAVLGSKVMVDGDSLQEVYDFVRKQGYADALILKVQSDSKRAYRIACADNRF
jgi:hypothetical protein